jgi:alpha-tubulin suppressor-like RCC1 family protein
MRKIIGLLILTLLLGACTEKKGEGTRPPYDYTKEPPHELSYLVPGVLTNQITMAAVVYPSYKGTQATTFSISPDINAQTGLEFSTITGRISGTPEVAPNLATLDKSYAYTITATNQYGSASTQISFKIIAQAPTSLDYNLPDFPEVQELTTGTSSLMYYPTYNAGERGGGTITNFTITPELPAGLTFDTATGFIEGAVLVGSPETTYTVAGSNSGGSVTTQFKLKVTSTIKNLAVGSKHVCIQSGDRSIQCWGANQFGQLGNNSTTSAGTAVTTPVTVQGINPSGAGPIRSIIAGTVNTCYQDYDFKYYCFGDNTFSQLPFIGANPVLTATQFHPTLSSNALSLSKGVYANTMTSSTKQFTCLSDLFSEPESRLLYCGGEFPDFSFANSSDNYLPKYNGNIITGVNQIATGGGFMCYSLLYPQNGIYCLGNNSVGQLGAASGSPFLKPATQVFGTSTTVVNRLTAGQDFGCYLEGANSEIYCWGNNSQRQLGAATRTNAFYNIPILTEGFASLGVPNDIQAGSDFACASISTKLYCWGNNDRGQLGRNVIGSNSASPQVVLKEDGTELDQVTEFSLGEKFACAISNSKVYCWGDNSFSQVLPGGNASYGKAQLRYQ